MKVLVKQTGDQPNSTAMEMVWCRDASDVDVMLSVAQLLNHAKDDSPWAPRILEIRIEL